MYRHQGKIGHVISTNSGMRKIENKGMDMNNFRTKIVFAQWDYGSHLRGVVNIDRSE